MSERTIAGLGQEAIEVPQLPALCDHLFRYGTTLALMVSPDFTCTYASPNHSAVTGWEDVAQLQANWLSHVHPEDREPLLKQLKFCLLKQAPQVSVRCDYRLLHQNNRWHWYRADIQHNDHFRCFDPKFLNGILIVSHDVGEFKYEQQRRDESRECEVSIEECRRALLSHVSHDLRTPLNAIVGFSELVLANVNPLKKQQYLEHIRDSGQSMLQAIEQLMEVSSDPVYDAVLDEDTHDIRALIGEARETLMSMKEMEARRFRISLPDYAVWSYLDGAKIARAVKDIGLVLMQSAPTAMLSLQARITRLGELEIRYSLPDAVTDSFLQPLVKSDVSSVLVTPTQENTGFMLTMAAQLLRLHQAQLDITTDRFGFGRRKLTITLPASRILSSRETPASAAA